MFGDAGSVSVSTTTNNNILSGRPYEFAPVDGVLRLGVQSSSSGDTCSLIVGGVSVLAPGTALRVQDRVPNNDDMFIVVPVRKGDRIVLGATTNGADTVHYRLEIVPA